MISPKRFWRRMAADLGSVFGLLAEGAITPHIAARMPLAEGWPGDDPSRIQDGIRQGRSGPMVPPYLSQDAVHPNITGQFDSLGTSTIWVIG